VSILYNFSSCNKKAFACKTFTRLVKTVITSRIFQIPRCDLFPLKSWIIRSRSLENFSRDTQAKRNKKDEYTWKYLESKLAKIQVDTWTRMRSVRLCSRHSFTFFVSIKIVMKNCSLYKRERIYGSRRSRPLFATALRDGDRVARKRVYCATRRRKSLLHAEQTRTKRGTYAAAIPEWWIELPRYRH